MVKHEFAYEFKYLSELAKANAISNVFALHKQLGEQTANLYVSMREFFETIAKDSFSLKEIYEKEFTVVINNAKITDDFYEDIQQRLEIFYEDFFDIDLFERCKKIILSYSYIDNDCILHINDTQMDEKDVFMLNIICDYIADHINDLLVEKSNDIQKSIQEYQDEMYDKILKEVNNYGYDVFGNIVKGEIK